MSVLLFDHDCLVDRNIVEVFGLFPFPVSPHDADAPVGVLVDPVYRPPLARAEARVDDAGVTFDEVRFELPLLEMLARHSRSLFASLIPLGMTYIGISVRLIAPRCHTDRSAEGTEWSAPLFVKLT